MVRVIGAVLTVLLAIGVLAAGGTAGVLAAPATAACALTPASLTPAAPASGTVPGPGGMAPAGRAGTTGSGSGLGLDGEQWANATVIVTAAARMRLPARAAVIALATALQESGLRNLPYGDADSLGLFQQRPSQGWGTPTQLLDPTYAATAFYTALLNVPNWQHLPITDAAQQVQHSATPRAYAQHEALATAVVTAVAGGACPTGAGGPAAGQAVAYALAQVGLPYVWGGNGPAQGNAGFDCSGLVVAAYAAAGIRLPRTAQAQYDTGPLLPPGTPLRAGDLLFFGTPTNVHHVGIYTAAPHQMVDAAHTGTLIRVEDYTTWPDLLAASRPAP